MTPLMECVSLAHRYRLAPLQRAATLRVCHIMAVDLKLVDRANSTLSEIESEVRITSSSNCVGHRLILLTSVSWGREP